MRILKWVWATYETLSLWQWVVALPIGTSGLAAMPIVGIINEWPLWVQVVASGGVALVWLTVFTGLVHLITGKRTSSEPQGQSQQAQDVGRDQNQAGRDINTGINVVSHNQSGGTVIGKLQSDREDTKPAQQDKEEVKDG